MKFSLLNLPAVAIDSADIKKSDSLLNQVSKPLFEDGFNFKAFSFDWLAGLLNFGIKVIIAIILFVIGRYLITLAVRANERLLNRKKLDPMVASLLGSIIVVTLYVILFLLIANILGYQPVSFAAILASVGLAIGMALSGQLQNLAGGVIILVTKPFRIGDFIESQSVTGTVKEVTFFHTRILTLDNKVVFVPNGSLSSGIVTNYSLNDTRRNEWTFGVEYNENFDKVKSVLEGLIAADKRILKDPAPKIVLNKLNDSSVDIIVRAWSKSEDLWEVYWSFNERVYSEFNKKGISFPFPQLTVHYADKAPSPDRTKDKIDNFSSNFDL
ncbi:mechanosensitive ion channel family protein [Porphyromonas pogonae]|uniref:mechanosensitive ion channel family protein n=1 Tax=Porphyromonas pogonae TaxID=867595 RepID=UPI002E79FDA5|nr:mechanosensitive ion channel domain-containing protein [Porphyromonas pogonae]